MGAGFYDLIPANVLALDLGGFVLAANSRAAGFLGLELAGLVGRRLEDLVDAVDHGVWAKALELAMATGVGQSCELSLVRENQGSVNVQADIAVCPGESQCLVVLADVTGRKRVEEALRASEGRLRAIIENEPECVKLLAADGSLLEMNPSGLRMIEAESFRQVENQCVYHLVVPGHRTAFQELTQRVFAGGEGSLEFQIVGLKGGLRWLETSARPLRDGTGEITALLGITRDITERKQAETALLESENKFRSLVEVLPVGVVIHQGGQFRYVSDAFEALTGYDRLELQALSSMNFWEMVHPDFRELVRQRGSARLRGETIPPEYEIKFLTKAGVERWGVLRATRVEFEGQPAVLAVVIDITERKQAEEVLRKAERRMNTVFNANPAAICVASMDEGRVIDVNESFARFVGLEREELIGRTVYEVQLWVDTEERLALVARLEAGESPRNVEAKFARSGGEVRDVLVSCELIELPGEIKPVILGMFVDVTAHKQAEVRLRESEASKRAIWESSLDGIITMDHEGLIQDFNPAAERIFGYKLGEVIDRPLAETLIPARLRDRHREALRRYLTLGEGPILNKRVELDALRADGSEFPIELTVVAVSSGSRPVFIGTLRDIAQRREAEEALKTAMQKYQSIFENSIEGIFQTTPDGKCLTVNPAMARIFGYDSPAEMIEERQDIGKQGYVDPSRREEFRKQMEAEGVVQKFEYQARCKDGRLIWVSENARAVRDGTGRILFYEGSVEDITVKKALNERLLRNQRLESIGTLAGGIAHDLNNVLSPILMSIEILRLRYPQPEAARILSTIEASAIRGGEMVKQVLTFARGLKGERVQLQIGELICEIAKIFIQTFPKTIEVCTTVSPSPWPLMGDATQLHQVVMNLGVNARDAMPDGGRLLLGVTNTLIDETFAEMNPEAKPGPYVVLTVTDTGTGIPAHIQERIFEPFFSTKPFDKGTGLGLATVRGIVKSHGGFVTLHSVMGKGTEFKVYLPAEAGQTLGSPPLEPPAVPWGKGELILVVGDEAAILETTKQTLDHFGYETITAGDGAEAVAVCARHLGKIKLLVTDMMMPVMDGSATVRVVRTIDPAIRIIGTSGLGTEAKVMDRDDLRLDAFLHKPYTADRLLRTVHEVLNQHSSVGR